METITLKDALMRDFLPPRPADGNKGTFGRTLLFCGSRTYMGAALLSASAALRCGGGLAVLCAPADVCKAALIRTPELICIPQDALSFGASTAELQRASAVLVGCGSGVSAALHDFVTKLLLSRGAPVVLDADALNALSCDRNSCKQLFANKQRYLILTPHPLEFSRLSGVDVATVQADRENIARTFAQMWGAVIVLKGAQTVIAAPDGTVRVVPISCPALAKGGSGDVLAGAITSFLAQGISPTAAACLGAYLHAKAGESLAREFSAYGVLPSDLPAQIAREINALMK